jgi:hypothetical protein
MQNAFYLNLSEFNEYIQWFWSCEGLVTSNPYSDDTALSVLMIGVDIDD